MKTIGSIRAGQVRGLVISLVMLVALAVAQPFLWNFVRASATVLHDKRTEEEQFANLKIRVEEVSKHSNALDEELKKLSVSFPSTNVPAQLVERIESSARTAGVGVIIKTISEGEVASLKRKADTGIVPLTITVEVVGAPGELLGYLQQLEHVPEVTTVDSWSLNPRGATGDYAMVMNIVFYLQPESDG